MNDTEFHSPIGDNQNTRMPVIWSEIGMTIAWLLIGCSPALIAISFAIWG